VNGTNILGYTITDMQGRIVMQENKMDVPVLILEGTNLLHGNYVLEVSTPFGKTHGNFIKE
jgi:hypothetical protein